MVKKYNTLMDKEGVSQCGHFAERGQFFAILCGGLLQTAFTGSLATFVDN